MASSTPKPGRPRGKTLIALLTTTVALTAGAQALTAAPAAAFQTECVEVGNCDGGAGGGSDSGGYGDDGSGFGDDLGVGPGGGSSSDGRTDYEREHEKEIAELDKDIAADNARDGGDALHTEDWTWVAAQLLWQQERAERDRNEQLAALDKILARDGAWDNAWARDRAAKEDAQSLWETEHALDEFDADHLFQKACKNVLASNVALCALEDSLTDRMRACKTLGDKAFVMSDVDDATWDAFVECEEKRSRLQRQVEKLRTRQNRSQGTGGRAARR